MENKVPFDVFVVEMWVIRPMIKFAPQEEKGAESVRQVGVGVDETDDSEYAFGVLGSADNPDNGEISVKIRGFKLR